MKKLIKGVAAIAIGAMVGCTPTESQVKNTATAIGYAAGLVAAETPIKDAARNAIVDVLNDVRSCIPNEGETFAAAWEPVIKEKVLKMVSAGKIDAPTGELVVSVALLAAKGVDYLFDFRFPEAKKYENLVAAGVSGSIDGFLTVFKPTNEGARAAAEKNCDRAAYNWFKEACK